MPRGLHRSYSAHHLHFITCSCYPRLPFLRTACCRDRFLSILEQTRERYRFVIAGYVVMPEHIHLLITEPEVRTPSTVMQVLKQPTARALLPKKKQADLRQRRLFGDAILRTPFWRARFYDFNVKVFSPRDGRVESVLDIQPLSAGIDIADSARLGQPMMRGWGACCLASNGLAVLKRQQAEVWSLSHPWFYLRL